MRAAVLDFAGVLGQHQSPDALAVMAAAAGFTSVDAFTSAYWLHRERYDAGELSDEVYWSRVCEGRTEVTASRLRRLVTLDVQSWLEPNAAVLDVSHLAADSGTPIALLSNAPAPLADAIDETDWVQHFAPRFFSSRLRLAKPDERIYRVVLDEWGVPPEECVFVDDRAPNVATAERVGMRGIRYEDPASLEEELRALGLITVSAPGHEKSPGR